MVIQVFLTLSRRRPLSYRNQSIDLQSKSIDWFLYDNGLRLERVKCNIFEYKITIYGDKFFFIITAGIKEFKTATHTKECSLFSFTVSRAPCVFVLLVNKKRKEEIVKDLEFFWSRF